MYTAVEVNKPFPYPEILPKNGGCRLELGTHGNLTLFIQFPNMTDGEYKAFKSGFEGYSYFESRLDITIGIWVFKFPSPVGYIDAPFSASLIKDKRAFDYLYEPEYRENNALTTYIVDKNITKICRMSGLNYGAIELFKNTIDRQMPEKITYEKYGIELQKLFNRYTSKQLYQFGKKFKHSRKVITFDTGIIDIFNN